MCYRIASSNGVRLSRFLTTKSIPPSHFSNPDSFPQPYSDSTTSSENKNPAKESSLDAPGNSNQDFNPPVNPSSSSKGRSESSIKELTSLLAMCSLAYLAVDNYTNRIRLEKLNNETTAINLKTLQIQQANFMNSRKKRDLQVLQERKDNDKRSFKMRLHIALLRKQLTDAGIKPIEIDEAIMEFEKSAKAENSIKNVSGQALWLDDSSPLKGFLPDSHDYEKKKVEGSPST